jgi:hypothetical protein
LREAHNRAGARQLLRMARDFDDIVTDLENGAIDVRHPELMPQS